jgi:hypothetical protein
VLRVSLPFPFLYLPTTSANTRDLLSRKEADVVVKIDSLKKTEITGNKDIDGIQSSVGNAVGNLVGSNGPAGVVGDNVDKHVLRGNV